jgi:hypothetical protein
VTKPHVSIGVCEPPLTRRATKRSPEQFPPPASFLLRPIKELLRAREEEAIGVNVGFDHGGDFDRDCGADLQLVTDVAAPLEGMVKLIVDGEDGRLLGVHVVGAGAAELMHQDQAVLHSGGTIEWAEKTGPLPPEVTHPAKRRATEQRALERRRSRPWLPLGDRQRRR